jgi:hypothetical protein
MPLWQIYLRPSPCLEPRMTPETPARPDTTDSSRAPMLDVIRDYQIPPHSQPCIPFPGAQPPVHPHEETQRATAIQCRICGTHGQFPRVRVYEGPAFWGASVGQPCYSPHPHAIEPLHTAVLSIAHVYMYGPWLAMKMTSARLELVVCLC